MADVSINNVALIGNDIDISIAVSVVSEPRPLVLREAIFGARTESGYAPVEVEVLSGKRTLLEFNKAIYHAVPRNNDDAVDVLNRLYSVTQLSINCTAADAAGLDSLHDAYVASLQYYTARNRLLNRVNDTSLSYGLRRSLLNQYDAFAHSGLSVTTPMLSGKDWEFAESGGLNISYWTNGPYADVKLNVVLKTQL